MSPNRAGFIPGAIRSVSHDVFLAALMVDYPADGALVSSLVTQLYSAVERDFDSIYSNAKVHSPDPTTALRMTNSVMRVSLLDEYQPTVWEQESIEEHHATHPNAVWERETLPEYNSEELNRIEDTSGDDEDGASEREQAITAVAAYVDNSFTDAALESAELIEIIQGDTRYTVSKEETHTRVVNQSTGATLTFSDDFESDDFKGDWLIIEDQGFAAQDYRNLKAIGKRSKERELSQRQQPFPYKKDRDLDL